VTNSVVISNVQTRPTILQVSLVTDSIIVSNGKVVLDFFSMSRCGGVRKLRQEVFLHHGGVCVSAVRCVRTVR